ncbi:hypothetical protein ACNS7O_11785 [Haloferacaceae archaeon DSL9]
MQSGGVAFVLAVRCFVGAIFAVPALEVSRTRYGVAVDEIPEDRLGETDWTVTAFADLRAADQGAAEAVLAESPVHRYGDPPPFAFEAAGLDGAHYRVTLAELADPAPFPRALQAPLVAPGVCCFAVSVLRRKRSKTDRSAVAA